MQALLGSAADNRIILLSAELASTTIIEKKTIVRILLIFITYKSNLKNYFRLKISPNTIHWQKVFTCYSCLSQDACYSSGSP